MSYKFKPMSIRCDECGKRLRPDSYRVRLHMEKHARVKSGAKPRWPLGSHRT